MNNVDWSAGSIDNVFFSETGGDRGLSPITFSSLLSTSPYEVMRFGGEADAISTVDKLKSSIENILSYLVRPENAAEFSIAQMEGHWYGSGVQNYIEALDRQHQRYKRDYNDYKSHNSETAILVSPLKNGGTLAISSQPLRPTDPLGNKRERQARKLSIHFLNDGVPLKTGVYEKICDSFNAELGNAITASGTIQASITLNRADTPVDFVTPCVGVYESETRNRYVETENVTKAIIRNPFRESPGIISRFQYSDYYSGEEVKERGRFVDPFLAPEKVVVYMKDRPPRQSLEMIHLHKMSALIENAFGGVNHANIYLQGESTDRTSSN